MSPTMFSTSLARRMQAHSRSSRWHGGRRIRMQVFKVLSQSHRGAHDQIKIKHGERVPDVIHYASPLKRSGALPVADQVEPFRVR